MYYVVASRARFASVVIPGNGHTPIAEDFNVSFGPSQEFMLQWLRLGGDKEPSLQVSVFEDAFAAFDACRPFFDGLAKLHGTNPQPDQIEALLIECGFEESREFYPKLKA